MFDGRRRGASPGAERRTQRHPRHHPGARHAAGNAPQHVERLLQKTGEPARGDLGRLARETFGPAAGT